MVTAQNSIVSPVAGAPPALNIVDDGQDTILRLARADNPCYGDCVHLQGFNSLYCPQYRCKLAWQMWSRRGPVVQQAVA